MKFSFPSHIHSNIFQKVSIYQRHICSNNVYEMCWCCFARSAAIVGKMQNKCTQVHGICELFINFALAINQNFCHSLTNGAGAIYEDVAVSGEFHSGTSNILLN